jgi:hypothetical protein
MGRAIELEQTMARELIPFMGRVFTRHRFELDWFVSLTHKRKCDFAIFV